MEQPKKIHNILVVDDDQKICDLFNVFIKMGTKNVKCVTALDTSQALFKLENQEFDLVFIDQNLPGKSGLDFVRQLKSHIKHQNKKVILMSGGLQRDHVLAAVELGIKEMLVKPFTFAQLMEKLKSNLSSSEEV